MARAARDKRGNQNQESPLYESNLLWGAVSILLIVVAAMSHDLRWLLFLALIPAIFLIWRIAKHLDRLHKGSLEIFIFFFVPLSYATYGLYQWFEPTPPQFLIRIYPFPEEGIPCKPPLKLYHLDVQNRNRNSVPVQDLRIEFHFKNVIAAARHQVVLDAGSASVGGVTLYEDCLTYRHEEKSLPEVSKKFSFQIQQAEGDKKMNLNFVDLYVERWIEGAFLMADIVIDLSQDPPYFKKPDEVNSYTGMYVYEIGGKTFSGKINGIIPEVGDKRTIKR